VARSRDDEDLQHAAGHVEDAPARAELGVEVEVAAGRREQRRLRALRPNVDRQAGQAGDSGGPDIDDLQLRVRAQRRDDRSYVRRLDSRPVAVPDRREAPEPDRREVTGVEEVEELGVEVADLPTRARDGELEPRLEAVE